MAGPRHVLSPDGEEGAPSDSGAVQRRVLGEGRPGCNERDDHVSCFRPHISSRSG